MNEAPSRQELAEIARRLPGGASDLLSRRSRRYKELGLDEKEFTDEQLLDLLAREPKLLRRPIVLGGERVIVGHDEAALRQLR